MKFTRTMLTSLLVVALVVAAAPANAADPAADQALEAYTDIYQMSAYIGTGTTAPQDQANNEYVKFVLDRFKIDLSQTQFLTGDRNQQLGLMIASGTMPDVVAFWTDAEGKKLAQQFVDAGMVIESEAMLRNCPNLMADLNDTFLDAFRAQDGKLYTVPSYSINPDNKEAKYTMEPNVTFAKRTDIWESLGITENPATPDELYEDLTKLAAVTTADGSSFIPLQAMDSSVYEVMLGGMFGIWTHRKDISDAEKRFTQYQEFPEYVEFLQYTAKLYREGLLDPELFVTEQSVAISRQKEGRVGAIITWPNDLDVLSAAAQASTGDAAAMYNAFPIPKVEGLGVSYYSQTATLPNMMTLISAKAADPERIMKYLDWSVSTEGWLCQCYGAPGKGVGCWYIGDDGQFYYDQARRDEYTAADSTYENQVLGGWTYFMVGRYIYHINHQGFANVTESPDAQRMEAREMNIGEVFMDPEWELIDAIPAGSVEEVKSVAVDKVLKDGYQKIIMEAQDDGQVQAMYDDMMAAAQAAGLTEIEQEKYELYQQFLAGTQQ